MRSLRLRRVTTIRAKNTANTLLIAQLIKDSPATKPPDKLYRIAADIAESVAANVSCLEPERAPSLVAGYVLRYVYSLAMSGELETP